jgi:hypothetical protein
MMTKETNISNNKTSLEIFFDRVEKFNNDRLEAEARKSPEQRTREAEVTRKKFQAHAQDKIKKEHIKLKTLFNDWIKRDTWLIYDEAMPLIKAEEPEEETIFSSRDRKLWSIVQSCAGHSLNLINPEAKPKQWKVKPFEWIRWLKEKEQYIHPLLIELLYPKISIPPTIKTAQAINTREQNKRDRINAIKAFNLKAGELARKQGIEWSDDAIPVTKADFRQVLGTVNTAYKKISSDSFDRDIAEIGLKFKRGTKSNKNNILKQIFSIV